MHRVPYVWPEWRFRSSSYPITICRTLAAIASSPEAEVPRSLAIKVAARVSCGGGRPPRGSVAYGRGRTVGLRSDETPGSDSALDRRYRLLRRLGTGGMAVVWVAREERLDWDVAAKILADVPPGDADYRRRFERKDADTGLAGTSSPLAGGLRARSPCRRPG